jgi:hypothetical protein
MKRSPEREQFLSDLIITAVEGGIGYWSTVSHYQYVDDGKLFVAVKGSQIPDGVQGTFAAIHELKDDETGYKDAPLILDVDVMAKGLRLRLEQIANQIVAIGVPDGVPDHHPLCVLRRAWLKADRENDAGEFDADDCDGFAQCALFGEVRYA